ncbi:testis-specific serine/threonine-protein kinase 6 [Frankliniella occidentalis]|uniref:Testis-specific serine/threonine-protein kinase 6 n=1 Tax=Frankliniella occidentalis TaxID=133901 RepID=A0A9C6UCI6_FRAOC|nr:testis-specific serine/threonine-protein kinase 6 [Frankliniella occidentalis]
MDTAEVPAGLTTTGGPDGGEAAGVAPDREDVPGAMEASAVVEAKAAVRGAECRHVEDGASSVSDTPSVTVRAEARKPTVLESHGYTVGDTVGSGSYATVKVAKSRHHDCDVAVKIVSKLQAPPDYLVKFLPREIEVVKGLRHPNVMRFLQAIETTHRMYIVMEYASNGSLLDVIRRESHIDEVRGRRWFGQLADAVQYCHELGIVHRDIKCENLLMDADLNIKLSDFGFARRGESTAQAPHLSETFCGSYAYASPEILRGVPYQPQLADIWSMGVVLYAIVFGRLPFDDSKFNQLLRQVQSKVVFPEQPRVSAACKSLICRILAPARDRLRLPVIRMDAWLVQGVSLALPAPPPAVEEVAQTFLPTAEDELDMSHNKLK